MGKHVQQLRQQPQKKNSIAQTNARKAITYNSRLSKTAGPIKASTQARKTFWNSKKSNLRCLGTVEFSQAGKEALAFFVGDMPEQLPRQKSRKIFLSNQLFRQENQLQNLPVLKEDPLIEFVLKIFAGID